MGAPVSVVLALVICGATAGCTSDAKPSPMPTPSTSQTGAESPTPTPPTLPAAAEGTSPAAAKAFARYFVEAINFGMESGDTSALRAASASDCATCMAIADKIDQSYSGSAFLKGAGWRPLGVQYVRLASDEALVAMPLKISAQRSYASEGASPSESAATRGNLDLRMSWATGRWQVTQLDATQ